MRLQEGDNSKNGTNIYLFLFFINYRIGQSATPN